MNASTRRTYHLDVRDISNSKLSAVYTEQRNKKAPKADQSSSQWIPWNHKYMTELMTGTSYSCEVHCYTWVVATHILYRRAPVA